jgi:hypothetical protein
MTDPKNAAREIAGRLTFHEIEIKHTQALDLVAAGCGFASRHLLAKVKELPKLKSVNAGLLASAATALALHDLGRRATIVEQTTDVLVPGRTQADRDREHALRNEAFLSLDFRQRFDMILATLDVEDEEADEGDAPGEKAIDYDRMAVSLQALTRRVPVWTPIELALRDGADRLKPYLPSLSEDPDTAGGAVREFVADVESMYASEIRPTLDEARDLLARGGEAVINIATWLPADDRLRGWIDTATYAGAMDDSIDPEASGMADVQILLEETQISISAKEVASPEEFLMTDRGDAFMEKVLEDVHYRAWAAQQDGLSTSMLRRIAGTAIPLLRDAKTAEDRLEAASAAIRQHLDANDEDDEWRECGLHNAERLVREMADDIETMGLKVEFDEDDWIQKIADRAVEIMVEDDDSTPTDVLQHFDEVELVFHMVPEWAETDEFLSFSGPYLDPEKMIVDDRLAFALGALGYTVQEFRDATGNAMPDAVVKPEDVVVNADRIVTMDDIVEMIENASITFFNFVAYARVPITDLLALDLSRAFAFGNVSIGSHNRMDGTYHDVRVKREVVLRDGVHGRLDTVAGYGPNEVCDFVMSYYDARLYEPELKREGEAMTEVLDRGLAIVGIRRSQPGTAVAWRRTDEGTLTAQVGVYSPENGYSLRRYEATRGKSGPVVIERGTDPE